MNNKRSYFIIFILVATELIGFGLIIPILPQISHQLTSSGLMIGILLSSYSFAQFFAAPLLGQLSDKFGRKPILIISKIGTIASYLMLALTFSFPWLLISRLLDGFTGGNIAVARAYLADITEESQRSKAMAIIGVAFGVGFIIGPAIGGICYSIADNFSIAGYVGAALSLFSLIITVLFLKEPQQVKPRKSLNFSNNFRTITPNIFLLFIVYGVVMLIFSGFETSFSIYTEYRFEFNESQNSMLFLVIGVLAFIIQGSFTRFSIKPISKAIIISLFCMGFGLICTNLISNLALSLSMLAFLMFGFAIINTHVPAELSNQSNDNIGFILGCYESIGSIARILGPLIIYIGLFNYISSLYLILGSFLIVFLLMLLPILLRKFQLKKA